MPLPAGAATSAVETIATRLARFAQRSPDAVALIDSDARVTWADLDADATAIARRLLDIGNGVNGHVCLFFRDRRSAVASIVGTARAGGVYIPFDPADPEERLRFMLDDAAPIAMLTEPSLVERARALAPAGCVIVDVTVLERGAAGGALPQVDGNATAHLYYTSGSTGRSKGVRQTHANQLFFIDSYARAVGIGEGDRLSMLYSLSFGAGLGGIYRGVALGATLCAYDIKRDGIAGLADWLDRERITSLQTFPMVYRELAQTLGATRVFPHLEVLHLGGESLYARDVELFRAHTVPHCKLVHQLAATEISLIAQNILRHDSVLSPGPIVPVGRPIEGVHLEIRRDDGSLAGPDEPGELFACSRHVSPGYWNRPELDAVAFSADPRVPGGRCYRTGDFGRIDAAGDLHFLGRTGSRVKIRGYTIDLAEIDAALAAWPQAAGGAAAAESDDNDPASARLVAYVEAREGAARDPAACKRFLAGKLPLHMLPAEIRYLREMPRTPGGKLDHKRLAGAERLPADTVRAAPSRGAAPRDATQAAVAHVFEELLKVEGVGPDDDFFLLGGDSLMGADLQARLKDTFGVRIGNFHQDATVAGIAASIRRGIAQAPTQSRAIPMLVPLWPGGRETPLFMVHGRHGQAFFSPHFMKLLGDEQPVWALQARGLDGISEPHATIEAMVDDYVAEIRNVRPHGPYFLGGLCVGGFVAAAMARALRAAGEEVLPLLLLDPPNRVRARTEAHADPAHVAAKMQARRAAGRILGPMEDPAYLDASVRAAAAFDDAIARYRPLPYDGAVYVLSSRHRMQMMDPLELRTIFTGRYKRYEVGQSHGHALDPRNPVFAQTLTRCVDLIRAASI
ncbi:MAG: AMP-binding protein [Betaproteobacteria bacterium]